MTPGASRAAGLLYVGVVAALAASAFSDRNSTFTWSTEGAAMLLTLPALVPALPVIYVLGAAIWNFTNADSGGPMWPVTLVYASMFAGVAVANLWILHWLLLRRRLHRAAQSGRPEVTH